MSKCCNNPTCMERKTYVAPYVPDIDEKVLIDLPGHPLHEKEAMVIRFDPKGLLLELIETSEQLVFPVGTMKAL